MALQQYRVRINGVDTTMQLTDADAERLGATDTADSGRVHNKARATTAGTRTRKTRDSGDDDSAGQT